MKKLPVYTAFLLFVTGLTAQADVECFRHSECDNDDLCINTVCTVPESDLKECETDDDCDPDDHFATLCDDGFCKMEGVYCTNPAGSCYYESTKRTCSCKTGDSMEAGSAGSSGSEPSYTDEELYSMCEDDLAQSCGTEEPDIRDECSERQLEKCTELLERLRAIVLACDEESELEDEEIGYFRLASCCRDIDDEFYQDKYDCTMGIEPDDCAGFKECFPDDVIKGEASIDEDEGLSTGGESSTDEGSDLRDGLEASNSDADTEDEKTAGDDDDDDDASDDGDDDDNEDRAEEDDGDSGCSVATLRSGSNSSAKGLAFLLSLALAAITYRRKRQ